MSEPVSITEELRARIEELTRERDGLKHREDLLKIANEQLLHVNKSVARHGIITESVRRLTDLLSIESTNPTANETTDAAAEAIERLTRERDAANAKHETLSALVEGYRRERDEARAEVDRLRKGLEPIADGTVWNAKESAEFLLGRKP
jgi:chromosome segregation ATPase